MKSLIANGFMLAVVTTLSGCSFFSEPHEVIIAPPDYIEIDGPLRFEQTRSESREFKYIIADPDKYEVTKITSDNCEVKEQGNGYFSISRVQDVCQIEFETSQKKFDINITEIGRGTSRFVSQDFASSPTDSVSVIALSDYNTDRTSITSAGCEITSGTEKVIVELSNFQSDCNLLVIYTPAEDLPETLIFSLLVASEFSTYSHRRNVSLRLWNGWESLAIDSATVTGHLYGIQKNGYRRLLENDVTRTFRNVPGGEQVESRIFSERTSSGSSEIERYEFEVLSVTGCSFGLWSSSTCNDIIGKSDSFAIGVEADVIISK